MFSEWAFFLWNYVSRKPGGLNWVGGYDYGKNFFSEVREGE